MRAAGGVLALIALLVASGVGDAQGFVHAARIWDTGRSPWVEAGRSGAAFAAGILLYWLALYWAQRVGIESPGAQTLLWFAVTLVGVAAFTGELRRWALVDQVLAVLVAGGLAVLLLRVSSG